MRHDHLRLRPSLRWLFYAIFGLLFLSGAGWWIAHHLHPSDPMSDGGTTLDPWLLRVHGGMAMASLLVLGALYPLHILRGWHARRNRPWGAIVIAVCVVLIGTGYLLYYVGAETPRAVASAIHVWTGMAVPVVLVIHVWRGRATRLRRPPCDSK